MDMGGHRSGMMSTFTNIQVPDSVRLIHCSEIFQAQQFIATHFHLIAEFSSGIPKISVYIGFKLEYTLRTIKALLL